MSVFEGLRAMISLRFKVMCPEYSENRVLNGSTLLGWGLGNGGFSEFCSF